MDKLKRIMDSNPYIQMLINTFDLVDENGDIIPDKRIQNEYRFSLFYNGKDNTKNTIPRKEIDLSKLVDIIKSDHLKNLPKKERPYITPYGTFTKRNGQSLVHFNKDIICLDYDKLSTGEIRYINNYWKDRHCTLLSVVSPSGNGLKVLIKAEHRFTPDELYNGLKANSDLFKIAKKEVDLMQFVICQPMFIPYSEEPYFNPHATPMKAVFKEIKLEPFEVDKTGLGNIAKLESFEVAKIDVTRVQATKNLSRVNAYFSNRVNMLLDSLKNRPRNTGTHTFLYSVLMRLYPYLNQQTAIQEHELTHQIEQILLDRYNGDKSKIHSLHRSILKAKEHTFSLIDEINKTAKVKI